MQQLYLVSAALNVAPCALGGGDSRLFARASKLDPYVHALVGEVVVSGLEA